MKAQHDLLVWKQGRPLRPTWSASLPDGAPQPLTETLDLMCHMHEPLADSAADQMKAPPQQPSHQL